MGSVVLLDLMGGVALLLWGLHMVQTGILRAFGSDLRQVLSKALGNRFAAFAAGLGLTTLLQSSTATALMTASFAAQGLVGLVPALAILLGANVGTTLIVQLLSFNVAAVAPALFIVGAGRVPRGSRSRVRDLGPRRDRPGAGAAGAAHPARHAAAGRERAGRARAARRHHRRSGDVHPARGAAHVGGPFERCDRAADHVAGLLGLHHAGGGAGAGARCQPRQRHQSAVRGRCIAATLASYRLPVRQPASTGWSAWCWSRRSCSRSPAMLASLPAGHGAHDGRVPHGLQRGRWRSSSSACSARSRGCWTKLLPARKDAADPASPRYLDETALDTPSLALADAARETLRMGDVVEVMLRQVMTAHR